MTQGHAGTAAATAEASSTGQPGAPGHHDKVLIVDFGSQVTQLIARRVREAGVYCEIVPFDKADGALGTLAPKAVILSGGPASIPDADSPKASPGIFASGLPVLGICYGQQAMAHALGGVVEGGHHREFGRADVAVSAKSPLTEGLWEPGARHPVWMSHGDRITVLPDGFHVVASSENAPLRPHRRRGAPLLRPDVPPGGGPHARRGAAD